MKVDWLPDRTGMSVSFTRLTIVEANSISITYYIRHSSSPLTKREATKTVVREKDNTTVISGLDPSLDYHVIVDATNSHGTKSSPPQILPAGTILYMVVETG